SRARPRESRPRPVVFRKRNAFIFARAAPVGRLQVGCSPRLSLTGYARWLLPLAVTRLRAWGARFGSSAAQTASCAELALFAPANLRKRAETRRIAASGAAPAPRLETDHRRCTCPGIA